MIRRALNLLSLLSLLLCLGVTAVWAVAGSEPHVRDNRSGLRAGLTIRRVAHPGVRVAVRLEDLDGPGVHVTVVDRVAPDGTIRLPYVAPLQVEGLDGAQVIKATETAYRVKQCYLERPWIHATVAGGDVRVPYALLSAVTALVPAITAVRTSWRWFRKHESAGMCAACGYNLTCNVSGVCPECGAPAGRPAR